MDGITLVIVLIHKMLQFHAVSISISFLYYSTTPHITHVFLISPTSDSLIYLCDMLRMCIFRFKWSSMALLLSFSVKCFVLVICCFMFIVQMVLSVLVGLIWFQKFPFFQNRLILVVLKYGYVEEFFLLKLYVYVPVFYIK